MQQCRRHHPGCGVGVEHEPRTGAGGEDGVGRLRQRPERQIGHERHPQPRPTRHPQRGERLLGVPGQREGQQPVAAGLPRLQQGVVRDTAAPGHQPDVGMDPPGGVGEVLRERDRDPQAEHGQRGRPRQGPADLDHPPRVREVAAQVLQVLDLGVHRRLEFVAVLFGGRARGAAAEGAEREGLQPLAQCRVAAEADRAREPGHRGLAHPDPLGEIGDRQERRLREVLDQILRDPPVRR